MAEVTVTKIASYVRIRILMIRWFFFVFWDPYFLSYGEFAYIKIKLRVQVAATATADNLGQRGQSIIFR